MNDTTASAGNPATTLATKISEESVRSVWTKQNEAELNRLLATKERVLKQNMQPVLTVCRAIYESVATVPSERQVEAMANELMMRADAVTLSLKPFVGEEV